MKKLSFFATMLCFSANLYTQNYISNPSFESVTGTSPYYFVQGEVANWFGIGNSAFTTDQHICDVITTTAQDQNLFVDGIIEDHAIVNQLARPVLPHQKLNISLWAMISSCTFTVDYVIEFYVTNTASNTASFFPDHPNPNLYFKVGDLYIYNANDTWINYATTLEIDPPTGSALPCDYKYLVVVLREAGRQASRSETESIGSTAIVMLDNFNMTQCESTVSPSMLYNIDNDGICSKVLFTANCGNNTGLQFSWDFGDGSCQTTSSMSIEHTYTELGSYTVTLRIVDANGCVSGTSEFLVVDCPRCEGIAANFSESCINCIPNYLIDPETGQSTLVGYNCQFSFTDLSTPSTGSSLVSWIWRAGNSVISTQQNPAAYVGAFNYAGGPPFTTQVCLQVTDAQGCIDNFCKNLTLPCRSRPQFLSSSGEVEAFTVTPNPGSGNFVVSIPAYYIDKGTSLNILDMQGRLVRQTEISPGTDQLDVYLDRMENGIYIFSFESGGDRQFKKVVVQK